MLKKILWIVALWSISFSTFAWWPIFLPSPMDISESIEMDYPQKIDKYDILKSDSKSIFYMYASADKYAQVVEEIKNFWEKKSRISLKELEKLKKEYENNYKKDYRKLKNKKWILTFDEIKKLIPEYLELKKISKIKKRSYIRHNYKNENENFFRAEMNYKIDKEFLKQADNIYLISSLDNFFIPFLSRIYFNEFLKNKENRKNILEEKWVSIIKKIEKAEWSFLIERFSNNSKSKNNFDSESKKYYIIFEKNNIFYQIASRNFFSPISPFEDKVEFNRMKEGFFKQLLRKNDYKNNIFKFRNQDENKRLQKYMRMVLLKKLEKFETINEKKDYLEKITKLLTTITKNTKNKVEKLMETFVSDKQIKEISKEYNKIIKNQELFYIFISVIKEEEKILDFKDLEKIIF